MNIELNAKLVSLSCMLSLMGACAKDVPYERIDLEWDFSASAVTPTTAVVTASLPEDCFWILAEEDVSVYLTERKPENLAAIKPEDLIYGEFVFNVVHGIESHLRFFDGLKPNTTYYAVVRAEILFFDSEDNRHVNKDYYFNSYSFTTPPSGDYSGLLKEIECHLRSNSGGSVELRIDLPYGLRLVKEAELRVSSSPDMHDFKSYGFAGSGGINFVSFENPEKGRYYFEIVGGMEYMDLYNWNGEKVLVRIPGYLDL